MLVVSCLVPLLVSSVVHASITDERACDAWVARFRDVPALRVSWARPVQRPGHSREMWRVITSTAAYRWPDAVSRTDETARAPDERYPAARPHATASLNQFAITPEGEARTYSREALQRTTHASGTSLRDTAVELSGNSEYVLARWVDDLGPEARTTEMLTPDRARVTLPRQQVTIELLRSDGGWTVASAAFPRNSGRLERTSVFDNLTSVPGYGPMASRVRVYQEIPGYPVEQPLMEYTLVSAEVIDPAIVGPMTDIGGDASYLADASTGRVEHVPSGRDVTREFAGKPSQRVAWAWWLASVGTGLLVVAGGWWWLRRRGAM